MGSEKTFVTRRKAVTLADVDSGRDNNFNLIRMIAASGVLVSHAFPIALGLGVKQPFETATGFTLGWMCVAVFFAISGYLITRSFDRTARIENWASARVARLFPGLIVVSLLVAIFYGPVFTTLPLRDYFASWQTYTYVPRNVTLVSLQYELPGVFDDLPYRLAVNGSLWTLIHEVACYGGVLLAGVLGVLGSRSRFAIWFAAYLVAFAISGLPIVAEHLPSKLVALRSLTFPFAIGMAFYVWRARLPLSWLAAGGLALVSALLARTPLFQFSLVIAIAYATFVIAYRPDGIIRRYNALGDYSYGMYVYAFPVQQAAIAIAGPMSPLENIAIAFPVTLIFALASWYLVEKPSLDRRHVLAGWLGGKRRASEVTSHNAKPVGDVGGPPE